MKRRNRTTTITVLIVAFAIIVAFFTGILRPLRSATDQIFNPVGRQIHRASTDVHNAFTLVTSIGILNDQNQRLQSQVDDLKQQLANVREVQQQNDQLRAQFHFPQTNQYNLVAANVLGAASDTVRTVLSIDEGSAAGLRDGMAVISGGSLVGEIDSVSSFSAQILAVNDPEFKISAISQTSRTTGIISGQLGTGLKLDKIDQTAQIQAGETVVTAGTGLVPKGILIGQVESVQRADNAIFQAANVKPDVNTSKLEIVFIVTGLKQ